MKRNDIKALFAKSKEELAREISEKRKELSRLTLETPLGKQKNLRMRFMRRKDLAQILTVFRLKELEEGRE